MPEPVVSEENLSELCRQTVFLERNRNPSVTIDLDLPEHDVSQRCDPRQVGRALTNLLKNAAESVIATHVGKKADCSPWIGVSIRANEREKMVIVEDNGGGLPPELRHRLTEPYVTTRSKGTGLGLAIVKKIMEDHHGDLLLEDRQEGGARVTLVFPVDETTAEDRTTSPPRRSGTGDKGAADRGVNKTNKKATHGA
jgi:two-component system nitrogen regulation sensor histidine kinase NtrY